jgi:hypothetical protein
MGELVHACLIKLILKGAKRDLVGGWCPITLLGFIKSKFILDTLITAWKGIVWDQEFGQFFFLKIDFDKTYNRIK